MFKRVCSLAFSPCGSAKKVSNLVALEIAKKFGIELNEINFTLPDERSKEIIFSPDDLLVIASPTYAGKLPNKIMPDFKEKIKGQGTTCVAITIFGNRSFDNSLAELKSILCENGFNICAGAAIHTKHSMAHIGFLDEQSVIDFANKIDFEKKDINVPGDANAPYYVPKQLNGDIAKFLPAKPKTDKEKCKACKLCVKLCPMGSIDFSDVSNIPGICIKCHACVNLCPEKAKYFDDPQLLSHIKMLKANFQGPCDSKFFI